MSKRILNLSGYTTDGKKVVNGVFKLVDECGISLTDIFIYFDKNNLQIDWQDFIKFAFKQGMTVKSLFAKIEEAFLDTNKDFKSWKLTAYNWAKMEKANE